MKKTPFDRLSKLHQNGRNLVKYTLEHTLVSLKDIDINIEIALLIKQGRIHGYLSRVQVGRGSDGEGHWGILAGPVS